MLRAATPGRPKRAEAASKELAVNDATCLIYVSFGGLTFRASVIARGFVSAFARRISGVAKKSRKREKERGENEVQLIIPTAATYSCGSAHVYIRWSLSGRSDVGAGRDH